MKITKVSDLDVELYSRLGQIEITGPTHKPDVVPVNMEIVEKLVGWGPFTHIVTYQVPYFYKGVEELSDPVMMMARVQ